MPQERDFSLDLVGAGKLAKAIPAKAWDKLVTTACDTFTQCIAPITATTGGLGRLIQARFDRLVDAQKVIAAEVVSRASKKASAKRKQDARPPKASLVVTVIEASSLETDETLRELWANLLAQEFIDGTVHPEFVRTLSRMTASDAKALAGFASVGKRTLSRTKINVFVRSLVHVGLLGFEERSIFVTEHLASLHLIEKLGGIWNLSATGRAFIEAVSDPSLDLQEK